MAKLPPLERIVKEDFDKDNQRLIEKLALPLNSFMLQISEALNKGLNFDNLSFYTKEIDVEVDYRGRTDVSFKSIVSGRVHGIVCIKAYSTTNTAIIVNSTPFVTFSENSGLIRVTGVSGIVLTDIITNIATNGIITIPGHSLVTGQYVRIQGTGLNDIDNKSFKINVLDEDTININQTISSTSTKGFIKTDKNKFKINLLVIPA